MKLSEYPLTRVAARVTVPIPSGGVGWVRFVAADRPRTEPACTVDGEPLERGAEVVIARWDRGIAVVYRAGSGDAGPEDAAVLHSED